MSERRAREIERTWGARREVRTWEALCPHDVTRTAPLAAIAACLESPEVRAELREDEDAGTYPRRTLARLASLGLSDLLTDEAGGALTMVGLSALNAVAARASGSLAITIGVNALALLPFYVAADDAQRAEAFACVRRGGFASLLLTELAHGSNLVETETLAEPGFLEGGLFSPLAPGGEATAYRVHGEKDMINGAREHELLVTLARTRSREPGGSALESRGDFSLFCIPQGPGVIPLERWATLPATAADISGVRFEGVVVPAARRIGAEGDGFGIIQKTLLVSRGAIGALASGTTSAAASLAVGYARDRVLYGAPISALAPVAEHLVDLVALDLAVAAMSVKAALAVNAEGLGAAHLTAVAKYACCRIAEDAVTEGRRLVASRALVRELPYERVARDVLLYGVFDGTSHVMLAQLYWRLQQLVAARAAPRENDPLDAMRAVYTRAPRSLVEAVRAPSRSRPRALEPYFDALATHAPNASILRDAASALLDVAAEARRANAWPANAVETVRAADVLAMLECAAALVELADPAARAALGMAPARAVHPNVETVLPVALGAIVVRVLAGTRALAAPLIPEVSRRVGDLEEGWLAKQAAGRRVLAAALSA